MNLHPTQVVVGAVVSEKTTTLGELGQHVFRVHPEADKAQIKAAIEQLFEVKVESVRTLAGDGKVKRFKGRVGQRKRWKKAYVQVAQGQAIAIGEGA
ncbi:MAG: 50S ribosomal protein L23 [Thioalkalivibrionaceae bacterium]